MNANTAAILYQLIAYAALERMREKTPLSRLGEPLDVAYAYLYLASDEARFVNGAILSVDGGLVV